ncbi:MAG: hypothetical protein JSV89_01090 [Spirochaetaceae bacterium]|nr:MAG: hypothetical protein JSV89_01090 [Spirochaetaceae bacterium]
MIAGFRLSLRRLPDGRLSLAIPRWFKLLLLGIGLILLYALVTTSQNGVRGILDRANLIPLVLCVLSFLGAAYREQWLFDKNADRVTYDAGIFSLGTRRNLYLSDLENVEVDQFIRGRPHAPVDTKPSLLSRPVLTLSLYGKDGEKHRLEFYSFSQRSKVREYALAISSYCGIGLIDQTVGTE